MTIEPREFPIGSEDGSSFVNNRRDITLYNARQDLDRIYEAFRVNLQDIEAKIAFLQKHTGFGDSPRSSRQEYLNALEAGFLCLLVDGGSGPGLDSELLKGLEDLNLLPNIKPD